MRRDFGSRGYLQNSGQHFTPRRLSWSCGEVDSHAGNDHSGVEEGHTWHVRGESKIPMCDVRMYSLEESQSFLVAGFLVIVIYDTKNPSWRQTALEFILKSLTHKTLLLTRALWGRCHCFRVTNEKEPRCKSVDQTLRGGPEEAPRWCFLVPPWLQFSFKLSTAPRRALGED